MVSHNHSHNSYEKLVIVKRKEKKLKMSNDSGNNEGVSN